MTARSAIASAFVAAAGLVAANGVFARAMPGVISGHSTTAPAIAPAGIATSAPAALAPLKSIAPPQSPRGAAWWTDAGRILAGETPNAGSALDRLANQAAVQQHRAAFGRSWAQFEQSRLKPAMRFAQEELAQLPPASGPIYYPFSGPDALYALAMFPHATSFALAGLEPVGDLPDMGALSDAELAGSFAELRRSLRSLKSFSFFQTNDMRAEFSKNRFSGVTPILLMFIARHGYAVHNVEPVVMEPNASLRPTSAAGLKNLPDDHVPGVRFTFAKPGDSKTRTLYYFRADLSDGGLDKVPQPLRWAANFGHKATYIKSASYLLHLTQFTQMRNFVLARSELIVQDDSGIPMRYFPQAQWDRTFFGSYDGPIRLFANRYQKDLREAYVTQAQPLSVGIGYVHSAKASNIQRFLRKRSGLDDRIAGNDVPATVR